MHISSSVLVATLALALAVSLAATAGLAQGLITVAPPEAQKEPQERPVTFSREQADVGRRAYFHYCVTCHGDNLDDGEFGGPPLRGNRFEERFGGLPVTVLYTYIEAAMPPDRPGRISTEDRVAIIAYILSRNGYDTGQQMPKRYEAMDYLIIEK
jgi:mono/diheme cytochrome c family protein